jgi:hypothetical protein
MSEPKRTSPSFLIAVAVIVFAVVAYFGWEFVAPNPSGESELIVRNLSSAIAAEMGPFRRALREVERAARDSPEKRREAIEQIDDMAEDLGDRIVDLADAATTDIEMVRGISLSTQENRLARVRRLSLEGRARAGQMVAETKANLAASGQEQDDE